MLLPSCALRTRRALKPHEQKNYVSRLTLGMYVVPNDIGSLRIAHVSPDRKISSLVQEGDILYAVNGKAFTSRHHLLKKISEYQKHDILTLKVKRGKNFILVKSRLRESMVRKDIDAVFQELSQDKKVHLTIIIDVINNIFIHDLRELETWKSALEVDILSYYP